jgi:hypothetical protein
MTSADGQYRPFRGDTSRAIAAGGKTQLFARADNALFATGCLGCGWTQETSSWNTAAIATG